MNKYRITINELVSHEIVIDAATEEAARDQAVWLLSNMLESQLQNLYHYEVDGQFTGDWRAELLED